MYTKVEIATGVICIALGLFVAYFLVVYTPVEIYTEAKCLEKGYAGHKVSFGLSRYCTTLDGTVTVKVEKL